MSDLVVTQSRYNIQLGRIEPDKHMIAVERPASRCFGDKTWKCLRRSRKETWMEQVGAVRRGCYFLMTKKATTISTTRTIERKILEKTTIGETQGLRENGEEEPAFSLLQLQLKARLS